MNAFVICVLLMIAKVELIPEPYKTLLSTDKVAKFYMFFQMGKFVNTYPMFGRLFRQHGLYAISVIAYFVLFTKFGYDLQGVNAMSFILPACGIIVLTNLAEQNQNILSNYGILAWLGKNSLEIYVIHFLVLSVIPKDLVNSCGNPYLQIFMLFGLSVMCIGVSLLIAKVIHCSELLDFVLLGKGNYLKKIIPKIK